MLNQQGDVIRIVDSNGVTKVQYQYNAWGKVLGKTGELADINPIRYRGYYYDTETGFYYLQSRYYDPSIGRFINADDASLLGANGDFISYNLFAYCLNNPVNRTDTAGNRSEWASAGILVGSLLCIAAITVVTCGLGTATLASAVAVGAAKGALVGAAVGTVAGAGIGYAATGTVEGAVNGAGIGFGAGAVVGAMIGGAYNGVKYTQAANFLKECDANPSDVLANFDGIPNVKTLNSDTTVYRTWGGDTMKYGHWVSPNYYGADARSMLALPPCNTMENVSSFILQKGTSVLSGKVAPQFGLSGGGIQWWVGMLS